MTLLTTRRQTLDDLYREPGKAELIGGRIVRYMASGDLPSVVAGELFVSLRLYAKSIGHGVAYGDGIGFGVPELSSGRESFSPDASFYDGVRPKNRMRFIEGAPTFAIEVRSENDYGPSADAQISAKQKDYFEAGTQVVWDVDPVAETVTAFYKANPTQAKVFRPGDIADAEPALPGWRMAVSEMFGA